MGRIDELTAQIEAVEQATKNLEAEIAAKWVEHKALYEKRRELMKEKLRLLGWDV